MKEKKHTVLIIDDEVELLKSFQRNLSAKYNILTAESGDQGLNIVSAKKKIHCVLLDIRMPEKNGIETLKLIRFANPSVPIIIITGHGDSEIIDQAIHDGASSFLNKPISLYALSDEIDKVIESSLKKNRLLLPVHILLVDDDPFFLKIHERALKNLPYILHIAASGKEAMNIIVRQRIDILVTDFDMPEMDGLTLMSKAQMIQEGILTVMLTGKSNQGYDVALEAMKNGAINYLNKPVNLDELNIVVEQGVNKVKLVQELQFVNSELSLKTHLLEKAKELLEVKVKQRTDKLRQEMEAHKKTETKLRTLSNAIEQAAEMVIITDARGSIEYINPVVIKITGYSEKELLGHNSKKLSSGDQDDLFFEDIFKTIHSGAIWQGEFINKKKSGERYYESATISPIVNEIGNITHFVAIKKDITKEKNMEWQLRQLDKMASLGVMASGVAHEISNPNHFIMGNATLLSDFFDGALSILKRYGDEHTDCLLGGLPYDRALEEVPDCIADIVKGAQRIDQIVKKLKNYSLQSATEKQTFDINEAVESAIDFTRTLIKKRTSNCKVTYAENLPQFTGYKTEIEQVLINLITNSCQAIKDSKGEIEIATSYQKDTNTIMLTVKDEGVGIPQYNVNKIMDPFFTTKLDSSGTGLGLSVSFKIIKEQGGVMEFESQEGTGTTARVTLPVIRKEAEN